MLIALPKVLLLAACALRARGGGASSGSRRGIRALPMGIRRMKSWHRLRVTMERQTLPLLLTRSQILEPQATSITLKPPALPPTSSPAAPSTPLPPPPTGTPSSPQTQAPPVRPPTPSTYQMKSVPKQSVWKMIMILNWIFNLQILIV